VNFKDAVFNKTLAIVAENMEENECQYVGIK